MAGDTVASPVSAETTDRTTSEAGWAPSTTVNVAVEPASDTVTAVPDSVNAAVSSSEVVTLTVESATGSYASSDDPSTTATVTAVVWVPSTALSSTPATVTVCAVFQLPDVNVNVAGDTVASPVSAETTDRTTSEDGWSPSTTVKSCAVGPASDTDAEVVDNVTDALLSANTTADPASGFPSIVSK